MKSARGNRPRLKVHIRVYAGSDVAFGPGKAELLAHIAETGSISDAARRMEMSYNRAWLLVRTMNRCFKKPLVITRRGGKTRGGAVVTETGRQLAALYRDLEKKALRAANPALRKVVPLLRR